MWNKTLENMPSGLMLFNKKENRVVFENSMLRKIFNIGKIVKDEEPSSHRKNSPWLYNRLLRQ